MEVERRLDGSYWLRFRGRYLRLRHRPAPLASRTRGPTATGKPNQTKISCACPAPLEEALEPDISILRKTGHFYFALTSISVIFIAQTWGVLDAID